MDNYWSKTLRRRVGRRRMLLASSGGALGAALLAACGSDDDGPASSPTAGGATGGSTGGSTGGATGGATGSGSSGGASGLLKEPEDTSSSAKRGGTLVLTDTTEPPHLDAVAGAFIALSAIAPWTLGRLLELEPGHMKPADGSVMPGIAESWEWSPDGLEFIMKLRQGVHFHPIEPVNGRVLDMDDVNFSWQKSVEVGQLGAEVNSVNPEGPILGLETPDSSTIVVRLKEPIVYLPSLLAGPSSGRFQIMPREAGGDYDPRQKLIGTGPFYLTEHTQSVGMKFARHPDYWDSERPYVDAIDYPIIPEYSSALSQFKAGALHHMVVRAEDILPIKGEAPHLDIYRSEVVTTPIQQQFGFLPGSPFHDERVRQAVSMAFDRDLWIETVYNTNVMADAGLPLEIRWNTGLRAGPIYEGWWLDPQSSEFGENARFFEYNVEEAKKLLAAAGYPDGLETTSNHFTSNQFTPGFPPQVEISEAMLAEVGFRINKNIYVYEQEHAEVYRDSKGQYEGYSYRLGPSALSPDPVAQLMYNYTASGAGFYGFDAAGVGDMSGDPYLEDLTRKARGEMNTDTRREMVFDAQRYLAQKMYCVRWPGGASEFRMAQPTVRNFNVFWGIREWPYLWLDQA